MNEKEIPPSRFEGEMTRMMELAILKIGGLETKFDSLETRFDSLETKFDGLEIRFDSLEKNVSEIKSDVKVLKGQFNDVALMAIEDNKRVTKLESEVDDLKSNIH